jgi:hypothetical protein
MLSASLECDDGDNVAKYRGAQYVIWPTTMKMNSMEIDTILPS